MSWRRTGSQCVFALAAAISIAPARAQQTNIRSVRFYTVKPDRLGDFLAATKEYNAVVMKTGSDHYYSLWHSLTGDNEYARADNYAQWADLDNLTDPKIKDQAALLQTITTRIIQCTEHSHRIIEEVLPDLSLPPGGELPKMIRLLRTRVRPDRVGEYLALSKSDVLPAIKKSGLKFFSVAQLRYGAPTTEFTTVAGFNSWADLGAGFGLEKGMGKEGYQHYLATVGQLVVEREFNVYSLVPESSYLPPAK